MATIRVRSPSKYSILKSTSNIPPCSLVRLGNEKTKNNFQKDWKMYSGMATIQTQIPTKNDILKSCSLDPTFGWEL